MSITAISLLALIALTVLYGLIVLMRARLRKATRAAARSATLASVGAGRAAAPLVHATDLGHDDAV